MKTLLRSIFPILAAVFGLFFLAACQNKAPAPEPSPSAAAVEMTAAETCKLSINSGKTPAELQGLADKVAACKAKDVDLKAIFAEIAADQAAEAKRKADQAAAEKLKSAATPSPSKAAK